MKTFLLFVLFLSLSFLASAQCDLVSLDATYQGCEGDVINLESGADDTAIIQWFINNQLIPGETSPVLSVSSSGNYSVAAMQQGVNCTANTTVDFAITPTITFNPESDTYCPGDVFEIIAAATIATDCDSNFNETAFLPDGNGISYEFCLPINCFEPNAVITSLSDIQSICMDMEHSFMGDLDIEIIAPDGTILVLQEQGGGSANLGTPWATGAVDGDSNNITPGIGSTYCFLPDNSLPSLVEGIQPNGTFLIGNGPGTYVDNFVPAGDYRTSGSFDVLMGVPLNGDWCLRVTDNLALDNGYIFGVALNFDPALITGTFPLAPNTIVSGTWQDDPNILTNNGDTITASSDTEGTFCFTYVVEDDFGCTYSEEHCIIVQNFMSVTPDNLFLCDEDNDGFASFDLTLNDVLLSDGNPDFIISYHETEADALNNFNALITPYINLVPFNQTLYSRVASPTNDTCFDVQSFLLTVFETPGINNPEPIRICDDDSDMIETFDLTQVETQLLDGLTGGPYTTQYFETEANAENNVSPIGITQNYTNQPSLGNPQTIYIRVTDTVTGCFAFETVLLYVDAIPELGIADDLVVEEENSDGFAIFDLTINDAIIVNGDPALQVFYFETEADAQNFINPIISATAYSNIVNPQTIFANVQNVDTNCLGNPEEFNIEVLNILGVTDFNFGNVTLMPNPAINEVTVTWSQNTSVAEVNLYSIRGELVQRKSDVQDISETSISLSELASGVYFVQLVAEDGAISTQKLIKK